MDFFASILVLAERRHIDSDSDYYEEWLYRNGGNDVDQASIYSYSDDYEEWPNGGNDVEQAHLAAEHNWHLESVNPSNNKPDFSWADIQGIDTDGIEEMDLVFAEIN